jgi:hypothetical protein
MANDRCNCSDTARRNWGSAKNSSGQYVCGFCSKPQIETQVVSPMESGELPEQESDASFPISWERKSTLERALESGTDSATRVFRYGNLFEQIGKALQWINAVAAIVIALVIVVLDAPTSYKLLGILFLGLIWALGFLQTSFVRGLASYFQMRASDYLEGREKSGSGKDK